MRAAASRLLLGITAAALFGAACGCAGPKHAGSLRVQSLASDPVVLNGEFKNAWFSDDGKGAVSFMLSDVPLDAVLAGKVSRGQILHVELLWNPQPGSTPIESTATNATVRLLVVVDGKMGLYGGAGFAMPSGDIDGKTATLSVEDASLQLIDSTPGFDDLLSPAHLTGSFNARRDDSKTRQLNLGASQLLTNALGRARYVQAPPEGVKRPQPL